jgi:metallo-beta-lactamase class B
MLRRIESIIAALCAAVVAQISVSPARAQATAEWRAWNEPIKPFHVIDNIYYVGATEVSSFLITSDLGDILLDGGFAETAPQILANIKTLGFDPHDVKIIINSHAHFDHAAGLATLVHATGAKLLLSKPDSALVARGGRGDFQWGDSATFEPVVADRTVRDGETIKLGATSIVAHITPGHTRGCTTWTMTVNDGGVKRDVMFVCSFSAPGYQVVRNKKYPEIRDDYESSFAKARALPCDVLLGPHGSIFHMKEKIAKLGSTPNPFVDPAECKAYIDAAEQAFDAKVLEQRHAPLVLKHPPT